MGKRLLVIGLIATVLVVTRAGEASACSCAAITPAVALEEADAAFVGTLIDRPGSETTFVEDAPYTFEVESWVKGDFGPEVVVHAPNQGSACGIEAPVGDRVGLFVTEENGELSSSLCAMVDPDLLLAGDSPPGYRWHRATGLPRRRVRRPGPADAGRRQRRPGGCDRH